MSRNNYRGRYQRSHHQTITSVCGNIKMRGSVQQVIDKYKALAGEASDKSDKEMLLQHAEHYIRMQNEREQHV